MMTALKLRLLIRTRLTPEQLLGHLFICLMEMKKLQHIRKSRHQNYFHDMSLKISRLWNFITQIYIFCYYNFFPSDILSLCLHILSCIDSIWITHPPTGSNLISHLSIWVAFKVEFSPSATCHNQTASCLQQLTEQQQHWLVVQRHTS